VVLRVAIAEMSEAAGFCAAEKPRQSGRLLVCVFHVFLVELTTFEQEGRGKKGETLGHNPRDNRRQCL